MCENTKIKICENCNIEFIYKKETQKFCSLKCSHDYTKGKKFKRNKDPQEICNCPECNIVFTKKYKNQKFCSRECNNENQKGKLNHHLIINPKHCLICNKIYNIKALGATKNSRKNKKVCSQECNKIYLSSSPMKENRKINGKKGGIISASVQVRRSKAEIYFADLCKNYFGENDILCNEMYFKDKNNNFWDTDIIIKSIKTAVLYNGIWHYKQVRKSQKLNQIQARDKIKQNIITENGYNYYIVKDLGSFNEDFIKEQFNLFINQI
jgi:hypothetical protein